MDKQKEKKKKVLMPFGLRNKLIAAISMLLVSSIMMVSSTYAWFTLSTAPEVKNISTTVAGNGSLEIALMPKEGLLGKITAGVVGGNATLKDKNTKWGNQVVLSEEGSDPYGLSAISLNPAQLNYAKAEGAAEAAFVPDKPLAIAKYGFDGRIAGLDAQNVGVKSKANGEGFDSAEYGVRAIGELGKDAEANTVKSAYGYVVDLAMRVNTTNNDGTPGKLRLQTTAVNRIYDGSTNAETMGGGSTMSFSVPTDANLKAGALKELLGAIRITFVKDYGVSGDGITPEIIGTAKLDTSELHDYTNGKNVAEAKTTEGSDKWTVTTEGTAPIYLYKTETTAEGKTTETKLEGNNAVLIDAMDKNKAYQISAIVWLDGTAVKNGNVSATAAQSLTGTLNLQFSTDIKLNPAVNTPLKGE